MISFNKLDVSDYLPNYTSTNSTDSNETDIYPDEGFIIGYEVNIVLGFKYTASILSLIGSLFIMICYMHLTYLVKFKPKLNKKQSDNSIEADNNNKNIEGDYNNKNVSSDSNPNDDSSNKNDYKSLKMGYGHNFIFLLALSDFVLSISAFIKTSDLNSGIIDAACVAQGIFINFSEMSSICWTSIIAYSIYLSTKTTGISSIPKYYVYFFIFSYGFPIIFSIIPLFLNGYGPAGAWCWMNTKDLKNSFAWAWSIIIYIFNWLNIIFNLFAVIKSINYFRIRTFEIKERNLEETNFLKNFCIVLKFFPIILIICWLPPTINRLYIFISGDENTFLYASHAFFGNLPGFLNCIVYSYYYKNLIRLWFCGKLEPGSNKNNQERENIKNVNIRSNNYEKNIELLGF